MLGGAVCVYLVWFYKDYSKHWIVLLFGLLMLVTSFQFLKEFFRKRLSSEIEKLLNSLARTIIYRGFGVLILSALLGLPFLPDSVNIGIGRALFGMMGIALCSIELYCLVQTFASLRKYIVSKNS